MSLGLVACGSSTGPAHVRTDAVPTGASDVVLRIDSCCGFTSAEYQLGLVPTVSIYGDGHTIVSGPVTEQYPPHALPNLLTGHVDRAMVLALLDRARTAGLFETLDFGQPGIKDMPTTTLTMNDGTEHEQRVYALDVGESGTGLGSGNGLSNDQAAARARVVRFVRAVTDAATNGATEPYPATQVALYVQPATPAGGSDDTGVVPGRAVWPLGDLAGFGSPASGGSYRCGVLADTDATTALAAASQATSITRWESSGLEDTIVWRPLLPDEHACPGLETESR